MSDSTPSFKCHFCAVCNGTGCIGELGVPILMDLDFGHLPPQMPLISGAYAKVRAEDNRLEIQHILK